MKYCRVFIIILPALILFGSCGKLKGEFALRRFSDDVFRKTTGSFECDVREEVQWTYVFPEVTARRNIGIVIQKKEIGWIEYTSRSDYIDLEKKAVHGSIKGYQPGEYQIVILHVTESNQVLDRLKFYVYNNKETGQYQ